MFSISCMVIIILILVYLHYYHTEVAESFEPKSILHLLESICQSNIGQVQPCQEIPSVDCIYCIYMEDRYKYIQSRFNNYEVTNVTYVKACTPLDLTIHDYKTYSTTMDEKSPIYKLLTKFPVHISYLACMYHAWKQKFDYIMIFEDDILFTEPLSELIRISESFVKKNCGDVLYLGYCHLDCKANVEMIDDDLIMLPYDAPIRCKHAMIHKMSYVDNFLKQHGALGQRSDLYFEKYYQKNKIKRVICRRPFIFQNRQELKSHNENWSPHLKICDF